MIRRATPADAPALARIVTDWLATAPWLTGGPDAATLEPTFLAAMDAREIWVAGDPAQGYLSLEPARDWIHGFYVARPGRGTGRRLLDRVKAGRAFLQLRTHAPNHAAHRFYEREGFVTVERDLQGADGVPERRMEWRT